jgi:site-specific recombinase XerD
MHISKAIREFGSYQLMRGRTPGTERSYGYLLLQWGRWLAANNLHWQKAQLLDVERFLEEYKQTHARSSTALLATCLSSFYRWAKRKNHTRHNPCADLEPISRDRPIPRALTDTETRQLLDALDTLRGFEGERNRLIVRMFLFTGIRLAEMANIDREDVDMDAKTIRIRVSKGGRQRMVAINQTLYDDLVKYRIQHKTGPLFRGTRGRLSKEGISEMFRRVVQKQLGFKTVTAHRLRHTFGTKLRRKGADLRAIQATLGHAKIQTTTIYTAVYDDEMHKTVNLLGSDW